VYWPLALIVPGPEFASPPETAQVTEAAPPPLSVAVNCSKAPELELALHPVQLVSMETVPGDTESVPPPPPPPEAAPPQPARRTTTGTAAAASARGCQRRSGLDPCRCKGLSTRRLDGRQGCLCGSSVTSVRWLNLGLNLPGAFLAALPADFSLDAPILFPVSAGAYGSPQRQLFPHDL
jgi:hypothetical protein